MKQLQVQEAKPIGECGCELFTMDGKTLECLCGTPEEDSSFIYKTHCWNCQSNINSQLCVKSATPGMGYHCNKCGEDLTEWKQKYVNRNDSERDMLIYCDTCGKHRGYPINQEKIKGNCKICHAYAGPCNVTDKSHFRFNDIDTKTYEIAGFKIKQLQGVPVYSRIDMIEEGAPHKVVAENKAIFFYPKSIVVVNIATGKRIELTL